MNYGTFGGAIVLRLDPGEEILASLKQLCEREGVTLATVQGIGAVNRAVLGLFDPATKQYSANAIETNLEIVSLAGNVTAMGGAVYLHLHMAVADARARVFGGHLSEAVVSATAEIVVTRMEGAVERRFSEEVGLNLITI